jgi:hypothetical protein
VVVKGLIWRWQGLSASLVLWRGTRWPVAGDLPPDPWWIFVWSSSTATLFDKVPRSRQLARRLPLPPWPAMVAREVGKGVGCLVSFGLAGRGGEEAGGATQLCFSFLLMTQ